MIKHSIWVMILGILVMMPDPCLAFGVTARVDKTAMTPEEVLFLQVTVKGGDAQVAVDAITDFTVVPPAPLPSAVLSTETGPTRWCTSTGWCQTKKGALPSRPWPWSGMGKPG